MEDFQDGIVNLRVLFEGLKVKVYVISKVTDTFVKVEGTEEDLKYIYQ